MMKACELMWKSLAIAALFILMPLPPVSGQTGCAGGPTIFACTDEAAFLDLLAQSSACTIVSEGFEDNPTWGTARFPTTQPGIISQGITWASNNGASGITTSNGAARTFSYGVFAQPHGIVAGTPFTIQRDGFTGQIGAGDIMIGVGGWISTNTPGAQVRFVIDGQDIVFSNPSVQSMHQFFGVINTAGFSAFEVYETEGRVEDLKLIFGDDFSICRAEQTFINSPPSAENQDIKTLVATPVSIFLSATDPNGDLLTYEIVSAPAHGDLTGTPPNLVYTPDAGFGGTDSFTFRASDGDSNSGEGRVNILVDLSQKTFFFPQFVDGFAGEMGVWSTLLLTNTAADSPVRVEFYTTNGAPMEVDLGGMGVGSVFNFDLLRGELISLSTPGTGALKAGYARITAGEGVNGVQTYTGYEVLTGKQLFETAMLSATPLRNFSVLYDSLQNRNTGISFVFPKPLQERPGGAPDATITLNLYDTAYNLIAQKTLDPLAPGGYLAAFVFQFFEGHPAAALIHEMQGILTVESTQPLAVMTIRQDRPTPELPLIMHAIGAFPILKGRPD